MRCETKKLSQLIIFIFGGVFGNLFIINGGKIALSIFISARRQTSVLLTGDAKQRGDRVDSTNKFL